MENPFEWRHFQGEIILACTRWHLRYALSYRDVEEMMSKRGLCVDHTTVFRWVQTMPISTVAKISFPLDIPQVDVLGTKQTRDGKFIITVESRKETTKCGVCKKAVSFNYGQGQKV
jgi:hypothetical protein